MKGEVVASTLLVRASPLVPARDDVSNDWAQDSSAFISPDTATVARNTEDVTSAWQAFHALDRVVLVEG